MKNIKIRVFILCFYLVAGGTIAYYSHIIHYVQDEPSKKTKKTTMTFHDFLALRDHSRIQRSLRTCAASRSSWFRRRSALQIWGDFGGLAEVPALGAPVLLKYINYNYDQLSVYR